MSPTVQLALSHELVARLSPLPATAGAWHVDVHAQGLDDETLAWRRRHWDVTYWRQAFVEIEGRGRLPLVPLEVPAQGPVLARLACDIDATSMTDLRAGALLGLGVAHPDRPVQAALRSALRAALLALSPDT